MRRVFNRESSKNLQLQDLLYFTYRAAWTVTETQLANPNSRFYSSFLMRFQRTDDSCFIKISLMLSSPLAAVNTIVLKTAECVFRNTMGQPAVPRFLESPI